MRYFKLAVCIKCIHITTKFLHTNAGQPFTSPQKTLAGNYFEAK